MITDTRDLHLKVAQLEAIRPGSVTLEAILAELDDLLAAARTAAELEIEASPRHVRVRLDAERLAEGTILGLVRPEDQHLVGAALHARRRGSR